MAFEAIEDGLDTSDADGYTLEKAREELTAARELLSALKEEKPAIGGRVGRAIKRCEES